MKPPLLSDRIEILAQHKRDAMVEWVCSDEIITQTQCALEARLRMGTRDGVRNVLTLMGFVNDAPQVQVAINNLLVGMNVKSDDELKQLVESGRAMERIKNDVGDNLDAHLANGLELVKAVLKLQPDKRAGVIAELGGLLPVTNGGTH